MRIDCWKKPPMGMEPGVSHVPDGFRPPESKPDKRARRLIRALGDIDAL